MERDQRAYLRRPRTAALMSATWLMLAASLLIMCWPAILAVVFLLLCRWSVERSARRERDRRALARVLACQEPLVRDGAAR